MGKDLGQKKRLANNYQFNFALILILTVGVYIQVGNRVYTSNLVVKIFGVLTFLTVAFGILVSMKKRSGVSINKKLLLLSMVYFIYILTLSFQAKDYFRFFIGTADRNLGALVICLAFLAALIGLNLSDSQLKLSAKAIVLLAFTQSLLVGYQKFFKPDVVNSFGSYSSPAVDGTFYNANPLSFYLGIIACGLFAQLIEIKGKSQQRVASILIFVMLISGLIWSNSAQGLAGLTLVSLLFATKKCIPWFQRNSGLLLVMVYSLSLLVFVAIVTKLPLKSNANIDTNPFLERLEIYKSALSMISENFFTGVGVDNFAGWYGRNTFTESLKLVDNAHSIPLQIFSTEGFIGFLFYLIFTCFVLNLKPDLKKYSPPEWAFWQGIFFAHSIIGIVAIEHPVTIILAALSAGILLSMSDRTKQKNSATFTSISFRYLNYFGLIVSCITLVVFSNPAKSEIQIANSIYHLSNKIVTPDEFVSNTAGKYEGVYNARLLLTIGEAFIAIDRRSQAVEVAQLMLARYPDDQRTSSLFFAVAAKWNDSGAFRTATSLRNGLFPKSSKQ
jgi:O-antigen ligase